IAAVFRECIGVEIRLPVRRIKYAEAMAKYGSDKPDLRFGLEIVDVGDIAKESEFSVFREVLASGGVVRAINAKGAAGKFSNTELKPGGKLSTFVGGFGAKGLAWMKVEAEKLTGSIEKFFPAALQQTLRQRLAAQPGDLLLFVADKEEVVSQALGNLRTHLASVLNLIDPAKKEFQALWVIDFPSFTWDEEEKRWVANHHPFTAPQDKYLDVLRSASEADVTNHASPLAGVM